MSVAQGDKSTEMLLEPDNNGKQAEEHLPDVEDTLEDYGIPADFDFEQEDNLHDGAVAATTKVPGLEIEQVENYTDLKEYEMAFVDAENNIYGVQQDEKIGFIADQEVYPELDDETTEHVDLHEGQHFHQYDDENLWGEVLDKEYDLSDEMKFQLNYIDNLMDVAEDDLLGNLVDDAKVEALVEGYTERVTQAMQDNGEEIGEDFYKGYTALADHMMKEVYGTDPEEEFSKSN